MNDRTIRSRAISATPRRLRRWLLAVVATPALVLAMPARAAEEPFVPVVLIPPVTYSNSARSYSGGPNTEAARERLEDLLVNKNVKVVERSRFDRLLKESEFSTKSGLTDSDKAAKVGKALGANVIVMGSILDVTTDRAKFNEGKLRSEKTTVKAGVRIRVVDMVSGTITFSREFEAEDSYDSSTNGSKTSSDAATKVIKKAIAAAGDSKEFLEAINAHPAAAAAKPAGDPAALKPNKPGAPAAAELLGPDPKAEWVDAMATKNRSQWAARPGAKEARAPTMTFDADGSVAVEGSHLYATEFADGRISMTFGKLTAHPVLFLRDDGGKWYAASYDAATKTCAISLRSNAAAPDQLAAAKRPFAPGKHEMEFSASGKDLVLSIDGKVVARAKDGTIERGKAGVGGNSKLWNVRVQVSN
jgi:hypothetical protein